MIARGRRCALPVGHVVETLRPLPVSPLEGLPAYVSGVSVVRGAPTPVVDLGALLGGPPAPPTRWVIVRATATRALALAVDAVVGLVPAADLGPAAALPPLLASAAAEVVAEVTRRDDALLFVLEAARLVPEGAWAAVDAARAEEARP
ncbi:MAG: chemotaxis protein CheW [Deltaproteobacteria bacterium]|nr:chemotaxis protein CheW [Deltaproteobacteria bacterium]